MPNKFSRYFKRSLIAEEDDLTTPDDDAAAFKNTFEDESTVTDLDSEVKDAGIDPMQNAEILRKADKYAANITDIFLPVLRDLHDDIVAGTFTTVAPDIKGISDIKENLAKLAESLRGRIRDAIAKSGEAQEDQPAPQQPQQPQL
tara:strand:+ start:1122 stop:1556 length:435 start_codon:yes stop_codon:yes gene_type:complete